MPCVSTPATNRCASGTLDDDDWQDLLSDSEEDEDAPEGMIP